MSHNITETAAKKDTLNNHIISRLGIAKDNLKKYRRRHTAIYYLTLFNAVSFTALAGINGILDLAPVGDIIVVLSGAIGSALTFVMKNATGKNIWIAYEIAVTELSQLKANFGFYLSGKADEEIEISKLEDFSNKLDEILNKNNQLRIKAKEQMMEIEDTQKY